MDERCQPPTQPVYRNMKTTTTFVLLFFLLGTVTISQAYGFGSRPRWGRKAGGQQQELVSRSDFLRSASLAAACLAARPAVAAKTEPSPSEKLQAGFDSFNKEVKNIDRVVTKEAKKIDRVVTKETKKVTKKVNKDLKKVDRVVTKESKKVMRKVDKETKVVKREATKIGKDVEKKSKAFVGNVSDQTGVGKPAAPKSGIDVSRLKVCTDSRSNCL